MTCCYHQPVMLQESIEALAIRPYGVYVDVTLGGGGHTQAILARLTRGRVIAFDQDQDAVPIAQRITHPGFMFINANFRFMDRFLRFYGITQVDGILADVGMASHQLDTPARGFAVRTNGPLDMRMNQANPCTAQHLLNHYTTLQLTELFRNYGEVPRARVLAECIVSSRSQHPLHTVDDLKAILKTLAPRGREFKYYAQVFQALRIAVNDELGALKDLLKQSSQVLKPQGRLVVLSYHSLEDRLVKKFIHKGHFEGQVQKDVYGNILRPLQPLHRQPMVPTVAELQANNRARSARLRIGVRSS